jgi:hypothetical protein
MKEWFMGAVLGCFHMVILLYERAHTQTYNHQSPKIHGKWLLSTHTMYYGEGTSKSDLWKLGEWFQSPHPMRGHIHRHTIKAPKFMVSGSSTDI